MQRELNILEQIHQTLIALSQRLSQVVVQERAEDICDQLLEHDETVFAMKKKVISWMVTLEEQDRRSSVSRSSRKTGLSDCSLLSDSRKVRRYKEKQNEEEAKAMLEEEKERLNQQKGACKDVIGCRDMDVVRKEMKALDDVYREVTHQVTQIHELLPQPEVDAMIEWAAAEDDEIFQIKQQMIKCMATKSRKDTRKRIVI